MQYFIVYLLNEKGKKIFETFEVKNSAELYKVLEQYEFIPLKIFKIPSWLLFLEPIFAPRVTTPQIIELLDDLNIMLKAGIPIDESLKDILEDATNHNVKRVLNRISKEVSSGTTLSNACKPYEKYFTPTIINLMAIGEETGKLTTTLKNGAGFLRKTQDLKNNTKKALFTPVISISLMFVAVMTWMMIVVPGLVDFFKDMDTELPPLTIFLIDTSAFLEENALPVFIWIMLIIFLFKVFYDKSVKFRYFVLQVMLKIPLFSRVIKEYNIAYVAEYLHLSLHSGLTLYEALHTLHEAINNIVYKTDIKKMISGLEKGIPLSQMTKKNPLYTNFVTRILLIAETTGSMENELSMISSIYYEKVDALSLMIPKIVHPITLLIGGGLMAMIMLGLMGPIYDLIGNI